MPRPKMTVEELKERKKQRNQQYYQKNKLSPNQAVVYIISGLGEGKYYVGVTNSFQQRQQAHRSCFGDVDISPVLKFKENVSTHLLNYFECLIMTYHVGNDKCINKNNIRQAFPESFEKKIRDNVELLEEESKILVEECLRKIEYLNVA